MSENKFCQHEGLFFGYEYTGDVFYLNLRKLMEANEK